MADIETMIMAIRKDSRVGTGTCASIDECWEDREIAETLTRIGAKTCADAIAWAIEQEGLFLEKGLNQRWGEDDDPQLLDWQTWNASLRGES